jgi:hypothetical protein
LINKDSGTFKKKDSDGGVHFTKKDSTTKSIKFALRILDLKWKRESKIGLHLAQTPPQ